MKNKFSVVSITGKLLWLLIGVGVYFAVAQVLTFLPVPYWTYADDRPLMNEVIDVIGPTPEKYLRISSANSSGDMVGYFLEGGQRYYVTDGEVYGPFNWGTISREETSEEYWQRGRDLGWPEELDVIDALENNIEKASSTLTIEKFGPELNCFDTTAKTKVNVYHNGELVGTEEIKDGACGTAFRGGVLSDDGSRHAYVVRDRFGYFVVSHGRRSSNYRWIDNLHFEGSILVFNTVDSSGKNYIRVSME